MTPSRRDATRVEIDRLPAIAAALRGAARRSGTPVMVTDGATLAASGVDLRAAFPDPWIRQYSVKANDIPAVIAAATEAVAGGANVVSRGEWSLARRAGLPNESISFEGVGKTDADLRAAVRASADGVPLRWIAVESEAETEVLAALAGRAGLGRAGVPGLDVLFRLNPDVDAETHAGLAVGGGGSKFGMTEDELAAALDIARRAGPGLRPRGIHLHVGSQLGAVDAWRDAVRRALATLALLRGNEPRFDTLDIGGGFPVGPIGDPAPSPARFAREVPALLGAIPADRRPARLAIEPGRFLVARAGWLVGRVLHVRERGGRQVVIDAGMTELIRPALYGAWHGIVALTSLGEPVDPGATDPGAEPVAAAAAAAASPADGGRAAVHGPICESTDALGDHVLPPLRRGDLVAIRDAGAYGTSLASSYNGRPRAAEYLLGADGELRLVRRRGTLASLG
jgi:diaminopimelate decarboxylase